MKERIEYVQTQLQRWEREKQLPAIVAATGVSLRTLYYISNGRGAQDRTLKALETFLKKNVRRKRLDEVES